MTSTLWAFFFLFCTSLSGAIISTTENTNSNISYKSVCGTLEIRDKKFEKELASIFYTAYFKKETNPKKRPLLFCFNGGPGSSSVWLHMGLLGPKKTHTTELGYTEPPGYYEDNPNTLLFDADLVFIDPVATGYSTQTDAVDARYFFNLEHDIDCFCEFVRLFLTDFERWDSPRYIVGESYGTTRAVGLCEKLHSSYFIDVNGVILISMCLDFQNYDFGIGSGNDLPYILSLPTYAATAYHHKKLSDSQLNKPLDQFLQEVEAFSLSEYGYALLHGKMLSQDKKAHVIRRLARYTGLSESYIEASDLRVDNGSFQKELLRKESAILGRFDTRFIGFDHRPIEKETRKDPSYDAIIGPYTSSFQSYLVKDLKVTKSMPYKVLNTDEVFPWYFGTNKIQAGLGHLQMSKKLVSTLEKNPSMKVFIASGLYDLATPYFAADYTLSHLNCSEKLTDNITTAYYDGGHMMYLDQAVHKKMSQELSSFIKKSWDQA